MRYLWKAISVSPEHLQLVRNVQNLYEVGKKKYFGKGGNYFLN